MFSSFGDRKALAYLRRIADALDVIALHYAAQDRRMWSPRTKVGKGNDEEAEVMHTIDAEMQERLLKELDEFRTQGYSSTD